MNTMKHFGSIVIIVSVVLIVLRGGVVLRGSVVLAICEIGL
jgi:hypothetical protein